MIFVFVKDKMSSDFSLFLGAGVFLVGNLIKDWLATELQVYNKPCWDLNQYFSLI